VFYTQVMFNLGAGVAPESLPMGKDWSETLKDYEDAMLVRKQKFRPHKTGSTLSYRSRDYH